MSRARTLGLSCSTLLVALAALTPAGEAAGGPASTTTRATEPTNPPALTAGYGRVTPASRHTIDRLVSATRAAGKLPARATPKAVVDAVVRCASFEGQRYCLGTGWTDLTQAQVRAQAVAALRRTTGEQTATGDLSPYAALEQAAHQSPGRRASADRVELTQAARSVAKVWLLRHQIQHVPLPPGFLTRHPEVRRAAGDRTTTPASGGGVAKVKPWKAYPDKGIVLNPKHVAPQTRTYWCGPTSMQMIAWGWQHQRKSQQHWARRLGTTTSGSSITAMVRVVNQATGYDRPKYAGPYITLDISDWSFAEWKLLIARHVVDYRAPVVLHPVLLQRFYPYLDHDGSGHFQVGRGYKKRPGKGPLLGYFEPWNQQRFHPDEPFIPRVQWREAYRSYRANQAHFQHDLGV